ncbi:DNA starvation/stationary phase protection protein Dps [Roseomonas sp. 18066]|uniref:DNA starvation/stationary phase protection protein Dps n=1 Tax=Roseomonas sp. 18066 TaxID=2681412 RepID=UPI001357D0D0|nr:DNA starvation/stationary phase protection protein Dps [Roseomonas sp. 18066]
MALRPTRNDLGENAKKVSVTVLNGTLTDTIDLTNSVRMAHWTLRGPSFIGLHLMLEGFYNELFAVADEVAERLVQIGGTPDGTTQIVAEKTRLPAYPQKTTAQLEHVKELADRFAALAKSVREGIDSTDEAGDADTADLLTGLSRDLDKKLWMLEAHLEK